MKYESAQKVLSSAIAYFRLHLKSMSRRERDLFKRVGRTSVAMAVLIGGKVRAKLVVSKGLGEETLRKQALEDSRIKDYIGPAKIKQVIVVPDRIVNIVLE